MTKENKSKGEKWDGKSRVSNDIYRRRWNEIFKKGVVGKEVKVKDLPAWFKTTDCSARHLDEQEEYKADEDLQKIIDRNGF